MLGFSFDSRHESFWSTDPSLIQIVQAVWLFRRFFRLDSVALTDSVESNLHEVSPLFRQLQLQVCCTAGVTYDVDTTLC